MAVGSGRAIFPVLGWAANLMDEDRGVGFPRDCRFERGGAPSVATPPSSPFSTPSQRAPPRPPGIPVSSIDRHPILSGEEYRPGQANLLGAYCVFSWRST